MARRRFVCPYICVCNSNPLANPRKILTQIMSLTRHDFMEILKLYPEELQVRMNHLHTHAHTHTHDMFKELHVSICARCRHESLLHLETLQIPR